MKYFAQKASAGRFSGSKYNCIRPKSPCGTLLWLKIQLYPPKKPLRDLCLAQNAFFFAQMPPAGRLSSSEYNFIRQKSPCRTLFKPKIQFYQPKRPLRDDFLLFLNRNIRRPSACQSPYGGEVYLPPTPHAEVPPLRSDSNIISYQK